MSFINVRISAKIVMVLFLLGAVALGLLASMIGALTRTETAYRGLLTGEAKAEVYLTQANVRILNLGMLSFRAIAEPDLDKVEQMRAEFRSEEDRFRKGLEEALNAVPHKKTDLDAIAAAYQNAYQIAGRVFEFAVKNQNEEANALANSALSPAVADVRQKVIDIRMAIADASGRRSAQLSEGSALRRTAQ